MIGTLPSMVAESRRFGRKSSHPQSGLVSSGFAIIGLRSVYQPEVRNWRPSWGK